MFVRICILINSAIVEYYTNKKPNKVQYSNVIVSISQAPNYLLISENQKNMQIATRKAYLFSFAKHSIWIIAKFLVNIDREVSIFKSDYYVNLTPTTTTAMK